MGMLWGGTEPMRFVLINTYLTDFFVPSSREEVEAAVGGTQKLARAERLASHWPQL